jgi:hypothetical protein
MIRYLLIKIKSKSTSVEEIRMAKKSTGKPVHVTHSDNKWKVKKTGNERATAVYEKKDEAVHRGRVEAEKEKSELVIHRKDGVIQDKESHGNDPIPPKDKKP